MEGSHQLPTVAPSLCTWCALCALCYYSSPSSARPPFCHRRHSCVVRLWVLTLLLLLPLLPLLQLPLLLLLLLLLLQPLLLHLHTLLPPVQFIFCSICVFTLPFNAQKLYCSLSPHLPSLSVASSQQSERKEDGKEGRVEVQRQHALNCQLTADVGWEMLSVNITHTPRCAARHVSTA